MSDGSAVPIENKTPGNEEFKQKPPEASRPAVGQKEAAVGRKIAESLNTGRDPDEQLVDIATGFSAVKRPDGTLDTSRMSLNIHEPDSKKRTEIHKEISASLNEHNERIRSELTIDPEDMQPGSVGAVSERLNKSISNARKSLDEPETQVSNLPYRQRTLERLRSEREILDLVIDQKAAEAVKEDHDKDNQHLVEIGLAPDFSGREPSEHAVKQSYHQAHQMSADEAEGRIDSLINSWEASIGNISDPELKSKTDLKIKDAQALQQKLRYESDKNPNKHVAPKISTTEEEKTQIDSVLNNTENQTEVLDHTTEKILEAIKKDAQTLKITLKSFGMTQQDLQNKVFGLSPNFRSVILLGQNYGDITPDLQGISPLIMETARKIAGKTDLDPQEERGIVLARGKVRLDANNMAIDIVSLKYLDTYRSGAQDKSLKDQISRDWSSLLAIKEATPVEDQENKRVVIGESMSLTFGEAFDVLHNLRNIGPNPESN